MDAPTRPEFLHIPPGGQLLLYVLSALVVLALVFCIWRRMRLWMQGKPTPYSLRPDWARLRAILRDVLLQRKVTRSRKTFGAPMHWLLFSGFVILFIGTTLLAIHHWAPEGLKFHRGTYYLVYEVTLDVFGVVLFIGLLGAIGRRYFAKPKSLGREPSDLWLLGSLLAITITGFLVEGGRIELVPQPYDIYSPVGLGVSRWMGWIDPVSYQVLWWVHAGLVFGFLVTLPFTRIRHIVYAIFSTYMAPARPMGALAPVSMEDVEKTGKVGASEWRDYDRYQLASLDACMECGRCTDVCPATGVGKSLDPQRIVQDLRSIVGNGKPVAEALSEEALWDCTTCNACVRECPVNIRHVDLIVDARRSLVAEGRFAGTGANMLRQLGSTMNAWGASGTDREAWMEGLDVPLVRDTPQFDVLLWVGCAGAVDKGAQKTNRALVGLLKQAGVSFACLGNEEVCTGDPARRLGEEFLFQAMGEANIQTFKQRGVKRILTACPHCYNTFANEYPQFGGVFEVEHHTQFLARLVAEGKITPPRVGSKVAWHDPCYVSRVNRDPHSARKVLLPMLDGSLHAPRAKGFDTLCCGAGGGRMWMEEPAEKRPGNRRAEQLLATGAETIAVGCPFCRIMLGDSLAFLRPDGEVRLVDLAEMLAGEE
ncbi:MAG: Fe-S oxidoreductase [Fimbriimonadales bacterium]